MTAHVLGETMKPKDDDSVPDTWRDGVPAPKTVRVSTLPPSQREREDAIDTQPDLRVPAKSGEHAIGLEDDDQKVSA